LGAGSGSLRWGRNELDRGGGRRIGGEIEGLEAFELAEGVAAVALSGIDDALEAGEGFVAEGEGVPDRGVGAEFVGVLHLVGPDLGLGDGKAAEGPGGADDDVDEVALFGQSGLVALEVLVAERVEIGGIFAGNDEGLGIDAGFQGVQAGTGLALGGAGARGGVGMGAGHMSF
jgi:hypothetical protein